MSNERNTERHNPKNTWAARKLRELEDQGKIPRGVEARKAAALEKVRQEKLKDKSVRASLKSRADNTNDPAELKKIINDLLRQVPEELEEKPNGKPVRGR